MDRAGAAFRTAVTGTLIPLSPAVPLTSACQATGDGNRTSAMRFQKNIPSFDRSASGFWLRLSARPALNTFESAAIDLLKLIEASPAALDEELQHPDRCVIRVVVAHVAAVGSKFDFKKRSCEPLQPNGTMRSNSGRRSNMALTALSRR